MNSDDGADAQDLPVLRPAGTNNEEPPITGMSSTELAALETALAVKTRDLADTLLHNAMVEMEAALFERVSNQLKAKLPQLIHQVLVDHIQTDDSQ